MSLMTRNGTPTTWTEQAKLRALETYAQVLPVARNAGLTARQGADVVVAWATPRVQGMRVWAAPRVEQAGVAVRDQIGPTVSAALIEAARRLDNPPPPPRRRWPWVVAGVGIIAAAGSAVAAIMLRRRPEAETFEPEDQTAADSAMPGIDEAPASSPDESALGHANGGGEEEKSTANGRMRTS
jgi:hypothetical protein